MMIVFEVQTSNLTMTALPTIPTTTLAPRPVMRLPRSLIPERYNIIIQPHLYTRIVEEVNVTTPNQTLLFTGNSTVYFHCDEPTKLLFLHSLDLKVSSPVVTNIKSRTPMPVVSLKHHNDDTDFLEITMKDTFVTGEKYSLDLSFQGEISEYLDVLYISRYTETNVEVVNETIEER